MRRDGRGGWIRSMQALCDGGALGGLGDAELLGAFLERGEASAAAFEAVVARHAAMVLDVCRAVAGSEADAEDAFQATFLVLACRASSVRDRGSLGPWLFGVARRLAARAGADAARRRAAERRAAGLRPTSSQPPEADDAVAMLMEEVDRLPARYRDAVVLCHLQGLTYEAAAHRLGCPLGTLSTRLRRARERLRRNMVGRGVCGATALARVPAPAAPPALAASAARLGSLVAPTVEAGVSASILSLTRGALTIMKIRRFARLSAAFLTLAAGAWGWSAFAHDDPQPPTQPKPVRYQVIGKVIDEEGRPQAGAIVHVPTRETGIRWFGSREARSDADGTYALELPVGHVWNVVLIPPPGFWEPRTSKGSEGRTVVSAARPTIRRDFRVRRGMAWDLRITQGGRPAERAVVQAVPEEDLDDPAWALSDADGLARIGIPPEWREAKWDIRSSGPRGMLVSGSIRWDQGFRREAVRNASKLDGTIDRYWMIDVDGRSAMFEAVPKGRLRPKVDDGRLIIDVDLTESSDAKTLPILEGSVVQRDGKPIAGARVEAAYNRVAELPREAEAPFVATTDAQGRYRLEGLPAIAWDSKPDALRLVVTRDGFGGVDSTRIPVEGVAGPIAVPPIVLGPPCSVTGVVLGPDGLPLEGAEVEPGEAFSALACITRTDAEGRFTVVGLPEGPARLNVRFGQWIDTVETAAAAHDPRPIEVRLKPR